jgi:hypothetical protein
MSDDLDGFVRRALHDSRLELALEFHSGPGGRKAGAVVLRDASGATVSRLPLESAEEMNVALARIVLAGFGAAASSPRLESAPPARRPPEPVRPEATVLVAGVDG